MGTGKSRDGLFRFSELQAGRYLLTCSVSPDPRVGPATPGRFADVGSCLGGALPYPGIVPGVSAHSAAVSACALGQSGQQALQHLRAMQHHDIAPEAITYSAAVSVW